MAARVVYHSATFDPETRLPLVIINSTALPSSPSAYTPDLISRFIDRLPTRAYALVFFACGAPTTPSWSWLSQIYSMLNRDVKKRVGKVYIVHESWWVRAVTEMFRGVVSTKFDEKVVHIGGLSELAKHLDITQIDIPPPVYLYNAKVEARITVPRHFPPVFGVPLQRKGTTVIYPRMWQELVNYLKVTGVTTSNLFQMDENNELSLILRDALDRGQLLNLQNYGYVNSKPIESLFANYLVLTTLPACSSSTSPSFLTPSSPSLPFPPPSSTLPSTVCLSFNRYPLSPKSSCKTCFRSFLPLSKTEPILSTTRGPWLYAWCPASLVGTRGSRTAWPRPQLL